MPLNWARYMTFLLMTSMNILGVVANTKNILEHGGFHWVVLLALSALGVVVFSQLAYEAGKVFIREGW